MTTRDVTVVTRPPARAPAGSSRRGRVPKARVMMRRHPLLAITLTTWTLLYSRHGTEWLRLDEFASGSTCGRVRQAWITREASREIGSALASQPPENPLRQRAMSRALQRVDSRFRCESR
jgi:hypothetical protein